MCDKLREEIGKLETKILEIKRQQQGLANKLKILVSKKGDLQSQYDLERLKNRPDTDEWIIREFSWSEKIKKVLKKTFNFNEFRLKQLAAINATLDKKDVLLLMPTGGGKSLVYQLPTLVETGLTLVVSPLISLIEDQLIALDKWGIKGASINSSSSKQDKKDVHSWMVTSKSNLKLLFVTPEWLAKSKQFMSYLQKCYAAKNLNRIAVDEVHCCSTWGHDFRPDYNFLGLMKPMFPDVPFIGLTATATMNVLIDVQKIIGMEDATIITAPFNRPNLYYKVIQKPQKDDSLKFLENLLKNKYKDQSGIIYCTTIKETEELMKSLRERNIKVSNYHAQLEPDRKKIVHQKWLKNSIQAVVATIAFGMGIDKPDVRFVIHYSMPKSMEGLYQESGRAGRDGKKADCILMFSLYDYLKVLGMVSSKTEEKNALSVLSYCLENNKCRRGIIATHFEEVWDASQCNKMCDFCKTSSSVVYYDITGACNDLFLLIQQAEDSSNKLTLLKLLNSWFQTGSKENRVASVVSPKITKEQAERLIAFLVFSGYLALEKSFTMYSTIFYFQKGKPITDNIKFPYKASEGLKGFIKTEIDCDTSEPLVKKQKLNDEV